MSKKEKKEEFIIYNTNILSDGEFISENTKIKKEEIYTLIDNRQKRNIKIFCASIFLYFLAFAWLIGTMIYFEKQENEEVWLLSSLFMCLIATGMLIFSLVTKSKYGKIKYQYKNMKYFYVSCIFGGLGIFILFGGMGYVDPYLAATIGIISLGISASFDIYHDKTKGNKKGQISLWMEFVITILVYIICGFGGYFLNEKVYKINYDEIIDEYSKTTEIVYDPNDRAYLIANYGNIWYTFTNKYKTSHYELSVSNKPENLEIVYETDDVSISCLYGNEDYAVWSEIKDYNGDYKVIYYYYDKDENQVWELLVLPFTQDQPQSNNLGLYKDRIYYEVLDYSSGTIEIIEYNITTNETKTIYTITGKTAGELKSQSIDIKDNNLLVTTFIKNKPTIMHINLDKLSTEDYKPNFIYLNNPILNIYSASYDNGKYAVYYNDSESDKIGIYTNKGVLQKNISKFSKKSFAYNDKIYFKGGKLYWINLNNKNSSKPISNKFKLMIYDLKNDKTYEVNKIFDFNISNSKIYGLGFYRDNPKNTRLYEIEN